MNVRSKCEFVHRGALILAATATAAHAQTLVTKFHGENAYDRAGSAVAIDGVTAVVGAPRAHGTAYSGDGAAYVLRLQAAGWPSTPSSTGVQELIPPASAYAETFGSAVALSGSLLAVGEPERDQSLTIGDCGAVHVYSDDGVSVTLEATLFPTSTVNARAGDALSVSGQRLAIGAPGFFSAPPNAGEVFLYLRSTSAPYWTAPEAVLSAPGGVTGDRFGYSVALHGDLCVVGAPNRDAAGSDAGAAYVFARTALGWVFEAELAPATPVAGAAFGVSIALDGATALVGASGEDAAYLFRRAAPGSWLQVARLEGVDPLAGESFGSAVALEGERAVVGAGLSDTLHVFRRTGPAAWRRSQRLHERYTDAHGYAVALSGEFVVGGAALDDDAGGDSGAAFFFRSHPYVDAFGFGEVGACPCANDDPTAGCVNSTGVGARLRFGGSNSVGLGDFRLELSQAASGRPCRIIVGDGTGITPLGSGLRAVRMGGEAFLRLPLGVTDAAGTYTLGPGVLAANPLLAGFITPGETWNFQAWYRDPAHGACTVTVNFSNAIAVQFEP